MQKSKRLVKRKVFLYKPSSKKMYFFFFNQFFHLQFGLFRSFSKFLFKIFFFKSKPVKHMTVNFLSEIKALFSIFSFKHFSSALLSLPSVFYRFSFIKAEFFYLKSQFSSEYFFSVISFFLRTVTNFFWNFLTKFQKFKMSIYKISNGQVPFFLYRFSLMFNYKFAYNRLFDLKFIFFKTKVKYQMFFFNRFLQYKKSFKKRFFFDNLVLSNKLSKRFIFFYQKKVFFKK